MCTGAGTGCGRTTLATVGRLGSEGLRCIMAAAEELFDPPVTSEEAAALPPAAAAIRPTRRQLSAAFESPRFVEKKDFPPRARRVRAAGLSTR